MSSLWDKLDVPQGCRPKLVHMELAQAMALLDQGRPALLAALKDLDLALPERQAVAKAIAVYKRTGQGTAPHEHKPPPLLVCMYSAGLSPQQGRSLFSKLLTATNAQENHLILHHYTHPEFVGCRTWDAYVGELCRRIEEAVSHEKNRPVVLVAHSHGAVAAYGVACRMGRRARLLCVLARRPPTIPLLPDVWNVPDANSFSRLDVSAVMKGLTNTYRSPFLLPHVDVEEAKWPQAVRDTVGAVVPLYASPLALCAQDDIISALGTSPEPIDTPILAITATRESANGETRDKMEGWKCLTRATFELQSVESDHMGVVMHQDALTLVTEQIKKFV